MPEKTEVIGRIECSIWLNGQNGWGVNILNGKRARQRHFDRDKSPVWIEIDGIQVACNVDKDGFWKEKKPCVHLIRRSIGLWAKNNNLRTGDRVWLEILEPKRRFRLTQA